MRNLMMIGVCVLFFQLSLIAFGQSDFPVDKPVGGEPFGTSVTSIGDGIYVFRWWVYRNVFIVTEDGVIVTDPLNPKASVMLKKEIRKITDKPVKYVVYSHNHHDHISGGTVFQNEGAKFVGHKNLLKELRDHPSPHIPMPTKTFRKNYNLKLGNRVLELRYFGVNHGNSLIIMRLPKEKIAFIVDIVTPRRVAFRGMPDFFPDEWVRSLKEIETLDIDYVISGHGPESEPAIDAASVVKEQREFVEDLMKVVKTAMDNGTHNPDELRKKIKLPKYEKWQFYKEWLPMNIERIWAFYHMGW